MSKSKERRRYNRCSFCGKGEDQVHKLMAGPGVFICDQCIELCVEVLKEDGNGSIGTDSPGTHSADSAHPEASRLTRWEIEIANLYARGMGARAIAWCLMRSPRSIELRVVKVLEKMGASKSVPNDADRRHDMYRWLRAHGRLWTDNEVEAIVERAKSARSALETAPVPPALLTGYERQRLEKHLAEERAMLEEALRALTMSFPEGS